MRFQIRAALMATVLLLGASAAHAATLTLSDDDFEEVGLDFTFNFFGTDYTSIFVGSNGFITFGGGNTDFSFSAAEFLSDEPRIAGWWDDLDPSVAGTVEATGNTTEMVVSWTDVPRFGELDSNSFAITLHPDGGIWIDIFGLDSFEGLVGISAGGGVADPGDTLLSLGPFPNDVTRYQSFFFELFPPDFESVHFEPTSVTTTTTTTGGAPEPSTLLLLGGGLFAAGYRLRRKP